MCEIGINALMDTSKFIIGHFLASAKDRYQNHLSYWVAESIGDALKESTFDSRICKIDEWDDDDFIQYVMEKGVGSPLLLLNCSPRGLTDFICTYLADGSDIFQESESTLMDKNQSELERKLLAGVYRENIGTSWTSVFLRNLFENSYDDIGINSYITCCEIIRYFKKIGLSNDEDIKLHHSASEQIDRIRDTDVYNNEWTPVLWDDTKWDEMLFNYLIIHLTPNCSDELIDISYRLTDIYDHTSQYDKARKMARIILKLENSNGSLSTSSVRRQVGCIYSCFISKDLSAEEKFKVLKWAKQQYQKIDQDIKELEDKVGGEDVDVLRGLFESNYGALYRNFAKQTTKHGKLEVQEEYLSQAEIHFSYSLKKRSELAKKAEQEKSTWRLRRAKELYQSKNNMAALYYQWGEYSPEKYNDALRMHQKVLVFRENHNYLSDSMLSKTYILGCVIEMIKNGITVDSHVIDNCIVYAKECTNYYQDTDKGRFQDVNRKYTEFMKLLENDKI